MGADAVAAALLARGIAVEAGLWHANGVDAWLASPHRDGCLWVLIELPDGLDQRETETEADSLLRRVREGVAGTAAEAIPVLLHGSTSSSRTWWQVGSWLAVRGWRAVALDLPSHGDSPAAGQPLTPQLAADAVAADLAGEAIDPLIGHSFGAVVAMVLAAQHPGLVTRLVLEEVPGPNSVDWAAEADAVLTGSADARRDRTGFLSGVRTSQPRWQPADCAYAVDDLARCRAADVAAGLARGTRWLPARIWQTLTADTLLLLAPDAAGVNRLEDSTALRGPDRRAAIRSAAETVTISAGHCIHRDHLPAWQQAVSSRLMVDHGPIQPGRLIAGQ